MSSTRLFGMYYTDYFPKNTGTLTSAEQAAASAAEAKTDNLFSCFLMGERLFLSASKMTASLAAGGTDYKTCAGANFGTKKELIEHVAAHLVSQCFFLQSFFVVYSLQGIFKLFQNL